MPGDGWYDASQSVRSEPPSEGARLAATPAEAIGAADVIVVSLTQYRAMYEIVGDATSALAGKVLINLSSDSPEESRRTTAWSRGEGRNPL
ncbi:MAG: hypothetical protein M3373_14385 [Gemmatimonadota bacterium]|nr:hypothetical protein [Gemmatimonadota bacterium]